MQTHVKSHDTKPTVLVRTKTVGLNYDSHLIVSANDDRLEFAVEFQPPSTGSSGPPARRTLAITESQAHLILELGRVNRER